MKRQEFIEKWLEALESGKYRQTKNCLVEYVDGWREERGKKYCCLGVACEVIKEDTGVLADKCEQLLPLKVAKKLGITAAGMFLEPINYRGKTYNDLTELNDGGVRFKTIARIIRENLEKDNFR